MSGPVSDAASDDLRERIAEALAGPMAGATALAFISDEEKAVADFDALCDRASDAVLAVLEGWVPPQLEQVGDGWCPVHGTALCPEDYMLMRDGSTAPGYHEHWSEALRCGKRVPVFRLRVEGERE